MDLKASLCISCLGLVYQQLPSMQLFPCVSAREMEGKCLPFHGFHVLMGGSVHIH